MPSVIFRFKVTVRSKVKYLYGGLVYKLKKIVGSMVTWSFMQTKYLCVTCWERADLLALVCGVCCEFVTFQWYPGSGVVLDCIDS